MPREEIAGFHVHICIYSTKAPPFENIFTKEESVFSSKASVPEKGVPRSLYDIARKVDRPLDARFTPLSIQWLDQSVTTERGNRLNQGRRTSMSPNLLRKESKANRTSVSIPVNQHEPRDLPSTGSVPGSPATSMRSIPSSALSTPVSRFVKESSFRINDDDEKDSTKSNAGSLEISFGIVHLFRDDDSLNNSAHAKTSTTLEDDTGSILAILGVPSYIGPADFLQLIEPAADAISQVRMIREETANRCMVLLKFRDPANAEEFHKLYADQPFDPAEDPDELCRVVYVTKVTVSTTSTLPYAYPLLANSDPWPIVLPDSHSSTTNNAHRITGMSELPTCPVCLERMDSSVTGLMTVTCQHTFHCSCLSRWSDSRCPVCRYTQSRLTKKGHVLPSFVPEHGCCAVCGTGSDLWVCLICATVGCGRYKAGHAHRHYKETGHLYSLELESQRVWDYAGDGYVHRLIQSKAEFGAIDESGPTPKSYRSAKSSKHGSSPMEASGSVDRSGESGSGGMAAGGQNVTDMEDKMEALGLEYSHLLSTQLESQRAFYEDQVRTYQQKAEKADVMCQKTTTALEESQVELNELRQKLEAVTNRHNHLQVNLETSLKRMKILDEDLRGEKLMTQGLISRIDKMTSDDSEWQKKLGELQAENSDLKEQVRDLMFFVEARAKVENEGGEDLRDGDVEVAPSKQKKLGTETSSKKKKKKVAKKPQLPIQQGESSNNQVEESNNDVLTEEVGKEDSNEDHSSKEE